MTLHFVGYDRLFGSHYDEYDISYSNFVTKVDSNAFQVKYTECISFPGPGNTLAMAENPMFEFVGASGYGPEHQSHKVDSDFKTFKEEHQRNYDNDREEAKRRFHFHQNHRYTECMRTWILCSTGGRLTFSFLSSEHQMLWGVGGGAPP